jgi:hypothetical protein
MKIAHAICSFLLVACALTITHAQTLDQSQLNYNSCISARTLPGYSFFQSFTAGLTGTLVQIDMGVFNNINGSGTLKIYAGTDSTGAVLQSTTVTINCPSGNCFANFTTSESITSGQSYTFHYTPGPGIPDPYGVQAEVPGTYPGGQFGLIDPSGVYYPGFDLVFRTFVTTSVGKEEMDSRISCFPNPFLSTATIRTNRVLINASFTLLDQQGKTVRKMDPIHSRNITLERQQLPSGGYIARLEEPGQPLLERRLLVCD